MYKWRPVDEEDFSLVCTFPQTEDELFHCAPKTTFPLTREQLEGTVRGRLKPTVVTTENGEVAAFADIYNFEDGICWLGNVMAATPYRGKGAAQFLVQAMLQIAKNELNATKIRLTCHNTNLVGLLFYKKIGFKPYDISSMLNKRGQTVVCIYMERSLQNL